MPRLLEVHLHHDVRGDGAPIAELSSFTERDIVELVDAAFAAGVPADETLEHVLERFEPMGEFERDQVASSVDWQLWLAECAARKAAA